MSKNAPLVHVAAHQYHVSDLTRVNVIVDNRFLNSYAPAPTYSQTLRRVRMVIPG